MIDWWCCRYGAGVVWYGVGVPTTCVPPVEELSIMLAPCGSLKVMCSAVCVA